MHQIILPIYNNCCRTLFPIEPYFLYASQIVSRYSLEELCTYIRDLKMACTPCKNTMIFCDFLKNIRTKFCVHLIIYLDDYYLSIILSRKNYIIDKNYLKFLSR